MKQIFEVEWDEGEIKAELISSLLRWYFEKMESDAIRLNLPLDPYVGSLSNC